MLTSLLTMVLGKLLSGSSDQVAACNVALRTQLTTTTTTMGCIRTMTALQMNSPASLLSPASPPRITTTAAATPRKPSFVSNPQVKPSSEAGLLSCICRVVLLPPPPPGRCNWHSPHSIASIPTVARTIAYLVLSPRLILQCLPSRQIRVVVWSALHPLGRCSLWHPCITPAPD